VCDGAVVGSAIVSIMENIKKSSEIPIIIGEFCRFLTRRG